MNRYTPQQLHAEKKNVPFAFNRVASTYDLATQMSQGYQSDLDHSAELIGLQGTEKVLDLCCGTGKSTLAVMKHLDGGHITAVDNSLGMLNIATRKFAHEVRLAHAEFRLQDAMELDFPNNHFDAVFTAYGLRNMPDYDKFLSGVASVLKPGGVFCIHDFSLANSTWAKWYWTVMGYGFIVPFCTLMSGSSAIYRYLVKSVNGFLCPEEIVELLQQNGFTDIKIHRHSSWRRPILHTFTAVKA
jgi:ubiquinone/menaquinone biosynthesis methyltransferase